MESSQRSNPNKIKDKADNVLEVGGGEKGNLNKSFAGRAAPMFLKTLRKEKRPGYE